MIAGFASGFISGTATVAAKSTGDPLARRSRRSSVHDRDQHLSIVLLAVTNIQVLRAVIVPIPFAGAAADFYGAAFVFLVSRQPSGEVDESGRAFSTSTAIAFATMLTIVLLVSRAADEWFGTPGVMVTAALAGFVDTHSAAISVATLASAGKITPLGAAVPILIALSANTLTKATLCFSTGSRGFA